MTGSAKFRLVIDGSTVELEGSEEFVSNQLHAFESTIAELISAHAACPSSVHSTVQPAATPKSYVAEDCGNASSCESTGSALAKYPNTFEEMNGQLKIIANVQGANKKAKSRSLALLYIYGRSLLGQEPVQTDEVRAVCSDHGCLDSGNFAKLFREKGVFVIDGVKGSDKKYVKLSVPGKKEAQELIEGIEASAN